MKSILRLLSIGGLVLIATTSAFAAVDTCIWTGALSNDTGNGSNWSGCDNSSIPETGDSLDFPATATNKTPAVNLPLNVANVTFSGGAGNYTLTGNGSAFFVTNSFNLNSSNNDISTSITFNGSGSRSISSQAENNSFTSNVLLSTGVTNMGIDVSAGNVLTFSTGQITGFATNLLIGDGGTGTVVFAGTNSMTVSNIIQISNMTVRCSNAACFGAVTNTPVLVDAAVLDFGAAVTIPYSIQTNVSVSGTPKILFSQSGTISGTVSLNHDTDIVAGTNQTGTFSGNLSIISGKTANFLGQGNPAFERIIQNGGAVSGAGGIVVDDVRLELHGTNAYTGATTVNAGGIIQNFNATGLGATSSPTTILSGGAMFGLGAITIAEPITISGNGVTGSQPGALGSDSLGQTYTGTITLAGNTSFFGPSAGESIVITGAIVGTGDLSLHRDGYVAGGEYVFTGSSANTYAGKTIIRGVGLDTYKSAGGVAIPGNLDIVSTSINRGDVYLGNNGGNQVGDSSVITLTNSGANIATIESGLNTEVVGTILGNGHIESDGGASYGLTVGGANTSGTFSGTFDNEDGTINKTGTGTWTLSGATFPGGPANPFIIQINGGAVAWNSNLAGMIATVNSGGTLMGTGTVGAVTVNNLGNLSVGNSAGCMTMSSLNLASGAIFTQEINNGTTPCTGYDQVNVTGVATLGIATLAIVPSPVSVTGNALTIIIADSVTGTFNGLANGATITVGARTYVINYTATTVTLTDTTVGAPVIVSGGGGSYSLGGCRDAAATNYERYATFSSGTCMYPVGYVAPVVASTTASTTVTSVTTSGVSATSTVISGSATCVPFFTEFTRFGKRGPAVKKLQEFLNAYEKQNIPTTGYFGGVTRKAVKVFQTKYAIDPASGSQLILTTAKLNELACKAGK